jgi:hypothetical protein
MHKKTQFGKHFDGVRAAQMTIVGIGMRFWLFRFRFTSDVVGAYTFFRFQVNELRL